MGRGNRAGAVLMRADKMIGRLAKTLCCGFLMLMAASPEAFAGPIGPGNAKYTVEFRGLPFDVFTYRPNCPIGGMLLVFHGLNRNAEGYRNVSRGLGDRLCMIVVAPLFDAERFPSWRYQMGGIVSQHALQQPADWTGQLVLELVAWVRQQEGQALPYSMIGHSAGGQFLSRLAAFTPTEARRIVIANPSTYVFASLQTKAPFGLGGVYSPKTAEAQLQRYLQTPVTIFIGQDDVGEEDLSETPAARAQGDNRYARGLNAYRTAQTLAQSRGWTFNWRLVELAGVGHDTRKMFSSTDAVGALLP
jgi:pimeloyl-ACP methyl ester carboxylesterase